MATPVDIDALLQPIAGDSATGVDIRQDSSPTSPYYKIKDARAAARAAERADVEGVAGVPDEWKAVVSTAGDVLGGTSKDLEIAAWMTEGLIRLYGFAGLRDGFKLIGGLADRFWEAVLPMPDEDGVVTRVAAITGLNGEGADGTLILPMRNVPVTQGSEHVFSYWQFEQALQVEKIADPEKKAARLAEGAIAMEAFVASVRETPGSFFVELMADIQGASQAFAEMNAVLERLAGADAPPSGKIRETLEQIASAIRFFAADKLAAAQAAAPVAETGDEAAPAGANGAGTGAPRRPGSYETREQALAELAKIAEFFRRIEPHSPISYTLEEAVRRGRMALPELLSELIEDAAARRLFLVSSGIKPPEAEAG